jgi:hypothetical protein
MLLKAKSLKMLNRSAEAKNLLNVNVAFFTQDQDLKKEYETLVADISMEQLTKNYSSMTIEAVQLAQVLMGLDMTQWCALPLAENEWGALLSDKDLAPFLTPKINAPDLTAVILLPPDSKNFQPIAFYFSKAKPIGYLKPKSAVASQAQTHDAGPGYIPLKDSEIVPLGYGAIRSEIGTITSDNNIPLSVFKITASGKNTASPPPEPPK